MIITRSPLRISFVGGGTDLPDFYRHYPGRVISATIDKYIYLTLNESVFNKEFVIKYRLTEIVKNPKDLQNKIFRAAILNYVTKINKPLEISSIADLPAKTGLGSSSSFSCALIKALFALRGENISKERNAQEACRLEIDILKEPIGKQDQYAAAYGGFNVIQFNRDNTVEVDPVLLDFKKINNFNNHLMLFYTGITRSSSEVLAKQQKHIDAKLNTYKKMSDSVFEFRNYLLEEDYKKIAEVLHEGWMRKKSLSENISIPSLDALYETALHNGAWGGKILGAGSGGCLLFVSDPSHKIRLSSALQEKAEGLHLLDFEEIPFSFVQSGTDVLFNNS